VSLCTDHSSFDRKLVAAASTGVGTVLKLALRHRKSKFDRLLLPTTPQAHTFKRIQSVGRQVPGLGVNFNHIPLNAPQQCPFHRSYHRDSAMRTDGNPRVRYRNETSVAVYDAWMAVVLKDRQGRVLWSGKLKPRFYGSQYVSDNIVNQVIHHVVGALRKQDVRISSTRKPATCGIHCLPRDRRSARCW